MVKYLMYCRKSSEDEERQMISNESQHEVLQTLVKRDSLALAGKLSESASAKLPATRPVFNDMVKRIQKGEADGILCWNPNRLSRNALDTAVLVDLMDRLCLQEIRTPSYTFRNTPGDKFMLTLLGGQAKMEKQHCP
jgi:site-specific DNA recombinase